jgi:predicted amidohydrolase YtcJ
MSGQRVVVGNVVTMDPARPRAEAIAADGGRIVAVGTRDEAVAALPGAPVETAPGAALVPGLVDSHVHMLWAGLEASRLSLTGVRSVGEALDRIRAFADPLDAGAWVVGGADFDAEELAEGRLPGRAELDRATGGRPLFLDRRSHDGLVNSAALAAAGVDATTPDPVGGVIERDGRGEATGLLVERPAVELVTSVMPPAAVEDLVRALEAIQPVYHAAGLTGVVDPALLPPELAAFRELRDRGGLTVRTTAMPLVETSLGAAEAMRRIRAGESLPGTGDEWLRIGAVKVFFDGGGSLGTALLREPWPGAEDGYFGNQTVPTDVLHEVALECAAEGWSLGVHTVGGAAMDIVLDVFDRVDRERSIRNLRFSLIHAYLWPSAGNVADAARLGVVVATQPPMQWQFGPRLISKFGAERVGQATPVRSWLDGGVVVAGGSDGPGIPPEPLFGMWQARTRRLEGIDEPVGIEEAVTAEQALALYTTGACYAAFAEHERGILREGMLADWTAVSVDPLTGHVDELEHAGVLQTVVGGRPVFEA